MVLHWSDVNLVHSIKTKMDSKLKGLPFPSFDDASTYRTNDKLHVELSSDVVHIVFEVKGKVFNLMTLNVDDKYKESNLTETLIEDLIEVAKESDLGLDNFKVRLD